MSQAPPDPGRRVRPFGPPTSVEFKFPKRSTSAAPRNPKRTRPDCSRLITPSRSRHCVAPRIFRGIGHGVDQLRRRSGAYDSVLEQAYSIWRMRFLRDHKCDQRQAHADEDDFRVANFAGGGGDHELAQSVGNCSRAALGWTAEGGCPHVFSAGTHKLIADFRGSAMVSKGSRAPSFSAIHFFSFAMMSISSFLSSAEGMYSIKCCS